MQGISGTTHILIHILIFPSKIWAKKCTLCMEKYGNSKILEKKIFLLNF